MGRSRYKVLPGANSYFATCAVVDWLPLFKQPELAQIVRNSMTFLYEEARLVLHAYVLMEDHLHLVGSSADFSKDMKNFKSFTARSIVDFLGQTGADTYLKQLRLLKKSHKKDQTYQVWQEGFHPQAILNEHILREKIEYVHYNPVRRGYVEYPEQWRYSSAAQYAGFTGLVPIEIL